MKKGLLLLVVLPVVFFSCRKDVDEEPPAVRFNTPANNIQVDVYDTLHVSLHITDNAALVSLNVKLLTQQMTPVLPVVYLTLQGTSADPSFDIVIDNIRISSGAYYLYAEVSDGNNVTKTYLSVNITEAPKVLKGFFALTTPGSGTINIYKADTSWSPGLWSSLPSDFTDMEISPYWQHLYVNGSIFGSLKATSIDGTSNGFTIPSIAGPTPYWGPMSVKDANLWVSYRGLNQFKSLDEAGNTRFTGVADNGFYVREILAVGSRIFTEQKDIGSPSVRMVVFSNSGAAIQESPQSINAMALFEKDADNIYVVGNTPAGQGHLLIYDFNSNGFWEPIILPAGTVTSTAQVNANTLLIGMSTGTVYKFSYNPVGLITWATGINPSQIRFNDVDETVFSAEGTDVKVYNYNPFVLQQTIAIPGTISDLELWFNK